MDKGREVPKWLDAELLFRLNYGPMTARELQTLRDAIDGKNTPSADGPLRPRKLAALSNAIENEKSISTEVTLLDRPVAALLHKSLYNRRDYSLGFETDCSPTLVWTATTGGISPFDYDSSSFQTFPMLWSENFVLNYVMDSGRDYSCSVVGKATKPPMAAIVMDMVDLVDFLKTISARDPKPLIEWTTEFVRTRDLRSLVADETVDKDWAARGFIADLFRIVACVDCTAVAWPPGYGNGYDSRKADKLPWASQNEIPGAGVMFQGTPPLSKEALEPSNSIEDLKASLIHSGPFKLTKTQHLDEHLTFNDDNEICLYQYWGSKEPQNGLPAIPSLRIYTDHALRKFVPTFLICANEQVIGP